MILLMHILIAVTSVVYTSLLLIWPSRTKLHISYTLIAATLTSGTILTVINPAHMLQACMSGLAYVVIVSAGVFVARRIIVKREAIAAQTDI